MYNFNKKQKILLGILTAIVTGFICYYVYAKGDNDTSDNSLELQNVTTEEKENFSDDIILVHVSGAVEKEGVVELKVNSRISDAIDKAGRIKRRCLYRRCQFSIPIRRWNENTYSY